VLIISLYPTAFIFIVARRSLFVDFSVVMDVSFQNFIILIQSIGKPMIKKIFIILAKILLAFVSLVVLYVLTAVLLTIIPVNTDFKEDLNGVEIFVTTNGVHTNICMPVKQRSFDWSQTIDFTDFRIDSSKYHYISIGWGEREFYLTTPGWKDLKFSTAFKACFIL
jgi:hypothetical protein